MWLKIKIKITMYLYIYEYYSMCNICVRALSGTANF